MEITEIKIFKMENKGKLLAYANVVLNNSIVLRGIKIIDGSKGRFIAMPAKLDAKAKLPRYREFYHPINSNTRAVISDAVLQAYERETEE